MATRLFLSNQDSTVITGEAVRKVLSTQEPAAMVTSDVNFSANGPSGGIQVRTDGGAVAWYSPPLKSGSISGDITINLWGYESSALANVGFRVLIQIDGAGGGTLYDGSEGVELNVSSIGGTNSSQHQWTISPTAIAGFAEGDRIKVTVFGIDAGGTMATGYTFHLTFNASDGNDGNSWIEFTEDLSLDVYPTPTQDGPQYLKYLKRKKDYKEITVKSVFEDGGVDTLEHAADAAQRYEFTYDGLDDQEADVLDAFWDAHRLSQVFTLIEPRDEPWTGEGNTVEVQFESFEGDHDKVWVQSRKVVLVHYPT